MKTEIDELIQKHGSDLSYEHINHLLPDPADFIVDKVVDFAVEYPTRMLLPFNGVVAVGSSKQIHSRIFHFRLSRIGYEKYWKFIEHDTGYVE